jgi:predicted metal-dependent phosphoesterase TrpH
MTYLHQVRRFDLHLHSDRSDGAFPAEQVIERCARGGLDVVALTDHDLPSGVPVGEIQACGRSMRVVGGAELSGTWRDRELHLLVYFPGEIPEGFRAFCRDRAMARARRYATAVQSLNLAGIAPPDSVAVDGERSLTRHHLARALISAGHAQDMRDAFRRFADSAHGHVPNVDVSFVEAIRVARAHGGVTSWAHPPLPSLAEALPEFVDAGLQALEGIRPFMTSKERRVVRELAKRYGLAVTGGSDWHGFGDGQPGLFSVAGEQIGDFLTALERV